MLCCQSTDKTLYRVMFTDYLDMKSSELQRNDRNNKRHSYNLTDGRDPWMTPLSLTKKTFGFYVSSEIAHR